MTTTEQTSFLTRYQSQERIRVPLLNAVALLKQTLPSDVSEQTLYTIMHAEVALKKLAAMLPTKSDIIDEFLDDTTGPAGRALDQVQNEAWREGAFSNDLSDLHMAQVYDAIRHLCFALAPDVATAEAVFAATTPHQDILRLAMDSAQHDGFDRGDYRSNETMDLAETFKELIGFRLRAIPD